MTNSDNIVAIPATTSAAISNSEYTKFVSDMLAKPEVSQKSFAALNKKDVKLMHAITGMGTEMGELFVVLEPYVIGEALTDPVKEQFADEAGDLYFYLYAGAKQVGAKRPNPARRTRPLGTPLANLLLLNRSITNLTSLAKKTYYGMELKHEKIKAEIETALHCLACVVSGLTDLSPADIIEQNRQKLLARHGGQTFSVDAVKAKDALKEEAATV